MTRTFDYSAVTEYQSSWTTLKCDDCPKFSVEKEKTISEHASSDSVLLTLCYLWLETGRPTLEILMRKICTRKPK